jgi:hypothetical protein
METSGAGKHGHREKGKWVKYRAHLGCWNSPCYGPFSLGAHFETYEPLISLIFNFFSDHSKLRITEIADTESADIGFSCMPDQDIQFKHLK